MKTENRFRTFMLAAGKAYWEGLLQKHGNNITRAAREAGIYRQDVYRYLQRYGIAYRRHKGAWDREPDPSLPANRGNCTKYDSERRV